ncbi:hypothetical protein [Archangium sp.]|uniref:hypothetical protein n=1 Tax=Archangium sp. TaxID=1872627 RepID=UPI003899D7C6
MLVDLDKAAKAAAAHPTLQQVLQKSLVLVQATKHGTPLSAESCREIQEAFLNFAQDPTTPRLPQALTDALAWLEKYVVASMALLPKGTQAQLMGAESGSPGVLVGKRGKDSFESSAAQRARTLSGESPLPPAQPGGATGPKEQLEPIKNWQMNPGWGKVKG